MTGIYLLTPLIFGIIDNLKPSWRNELEITDALDNLLKQISKTADSQRKYKSKHKYDLEKFGLTEEKIKTDCAKIYESFLNE